MTLSRHVLTSSSIFQSNSFRSSRRWLFLFLGPICMAGFLQFVTTLIGSGNRWMKTKRTCWRSLPPNARSRWNSEILTLSWAKVSSPSDLIKKAITCMSQSAFVWSEDSIEDGDDDDDGDLPSEQQNWKKSSILASFFGAFLNIPLEIWMVINHHCCFLARTESSCVISSVSITKWTECKQRYQAIFSCQHHSSSSSSSSSVSSSSFAAADSMIVHHNNSNPSSSARSSPPPAPSSSSSVPLSNLLFPLSRPTNVDVPGIVVYEETGDSVLRPFQCFGKRSLRAMRKMKEEVSKSTSGIHELKERKATKRDTANYGKQKKLRVKQQKWYTESASEDGAGRYKEQNEGDEPLILATTSLVATRRWWWQCSSCIHSFFVFGQSGVGFFSHHLRPSSFSFLPLQPVANFLSLCYREL